jgi:hypothetical protein
MLRLMRLFDLSKIWALSNLFVRSLRNDLPFLEDNDMVGISGVSCCMSH